MISPVNRKFQTNHKKGQAFFNSDTIINFSNTNFLCILKKLIEFSLKHYIQWDWEQKTVSRVIVAFAIRNCVASCVANKSFHKQAVEHNKQDDKSKHFQREHLKSKQFQSKHCKSKSFKSTFREQTFIKETPVCLNMKINFQK